MFRKGAQIALAWILILGAWEGAYRIVGWKSWHFPAPSHVLDSTMNMLGFRTAFGEPIQAGWPRAQEEGKSPKPVLFEAIAVSSIRLIVGFVISLALGTLLGIAMWRWEFVDRLFGPVFLGLQTLPSVCWVPLAILTLGLTEQAILFVLVLGSCFAAAISLRDGLRTIPPIYQRAGLMLAARGWRLYRYILLPASMPAMASSLRQGFSFAWRSLMGAELIFVMLKNHGLGYQLNWGKEFADVAQVVAVMIIMIVLAMIVDRWGFAQLERRVRTRFGLIASA
jgi:NitT/TauT family transport system permease protein